MKRYGNLYEKISSLENLRIADERARKGKIKSYGVIIHDKNRDNNIYKLHQNLVNGEYRTSNYKIFKIVSDSGKERKIYQLPYFPDRIMHHAIMNIMENIWIKLFTTDTYSCIKKRGIHGVVRKMKEVLKDKNGTEFCLKLDIKQFYPSINHDILKKLPKKNKR